MIKLKDLLTEAPKIKKVKNVSMQYFDAEYAGDMAFSGYFRKAWLYKKDNGEWFAVIITKNKNKYEIQLGKHKDKLSADKAAEKLIKRSLNKLESTNKSKVTYKLKGFTNTKMDELDAELSRLGIKGTPDFNKMTWTTKDKNPKILKIIKSKGGKKIKESVDEALDPYKDFSEPHLKPEYNLNLGSFIDHYQKFIKFMKKHKEVPDKNKREWALAIRNKVGQGMFNGHMNQMENIMDLLQKGEKFRNLKESIDEGVVKLNKSDMDKLHKNKPIEKGDDKIVYDESQSYDIFSEEGGWGYTMTGLVEAEYQGRKVKLGKPMQGDVKKFKVYVKNPKGNVVKVNFGQGGDAKGGTMKIRKSNPKARASFRARHNCDNPGPRHKARYWSCRKW